MPLDVRKRAKTLLECIGGSVGEKSLDIVYTMKSHCWKMLDDVLRTHLLYQCVNINQHVLPGCYSDTIGIPIMRDSVSDFLTRRDEGVPSASGNIFITHGSDHGFGVCNLGCKIYSRYIQISEPAFACLTQINIQIKIILHPEEGSLG